MLDGELFMANGRGTVIHDTGKIAFEENGEVVGSAGPREAFESEFEIFCEALA